jgi:hypothetical protein
MSDRSRYLRFFSAFRHLLAINEIGIYRTVNVVF